MLQSKRPVLNTKLASPPVSMTQALKQKYDQISNTKQKEQQRLADKESKVQTLTSETQSLKELRNKQIKAKASLTTLLGDSRKSIEVKQKKLKLLESHCESRQAEATSVINAIQCAEELHRSFCQGLGHDSGLLEDLRARLNHLRNGAAALSKTYTAASFATAEDAPSTLDGQIKELQALLQKMEDAHDPGAALETAHQYAEPRERDVVADVEALLTAHHALSALPQLMPLSDSPSAVDAMEDELVSTLETLQTIMGLVESSEPLRKQVEDIVFEARTSLNRLRGLREGLFEGDTQLCSTKTQLEDQLALLPSLRTRLMFLEDTRQCIEMIAKASDDMANAPQPNTEELDNLISTMEDSIAPQPEMAAELQALKAFAVKQCDGVWAARTESRRLQAGAEEHVAARQLLEARCQAALEAGQQLRQAAGGWAHLLEQMAPHTARMREARPAAPEELAFCRPVDIPEELEAECEEAEGEEIAEVLEQENVLKEEMAADAVEVQRQIDELDEQVQQLEKRRREELDEAEAHLTHLTNVLNQLNASPPHDEDPRVEEAVEMTLPAQRSVTPEPAQDTIPRNDQSTVLQALEVADVVPQISASQVEGGAEEEAAIVQDERPASPVSASALAPVLSQDVRKAPPPPPLSPPRAEPRRGSPSPVPPEKVPAPLADHSAKNPFGRQAGWW